MYMWRGVFKDRRKQTSQPKDYIKNKYILNSGTFFLRWWGICVQRLLVSVFE